jgi:hypothetical protein
VEKKFTYCAMRIDFHIFRYTYIMFQNHRELVKADALQLSDTKILIQLYQDFNRFQVGGY